MTTWTESRIADLTQLWAEGLSTPEIGKRMGLSKNTVVGKAHRLGLAARPSPIVGGARPGQPRAKPVPPPARAIAACQWPLGDPSAKGFRFCGDPAVDMKPYCQEHCAKAYVRRGQKAGS